MNSIGPVLFSLAIKASLLLVLAFLVTFALRRAPASSRRLVWVLAGACLLVLPLLSMVSSPIAIGHVWNEPTWATSTDMWRPRLPRRHSLSQRRRLFHGYQ